MAKLDIQSSYQQVPVHPDDHHLLGLAWKGKLYLDLVLPFASADQSSRYRHAMALLGAY